MRMRMRMQVPFPSRLGAPSEFADTCAHIVTNSYINGTVLRIDGRVGRGPMDRGTDGRANERTGPWREGGREGGCAQGCVAAKMRLCGLR